MNTDKAMVDETIIDESDSIPNNTIEGELDVDNLIYSNLNMMGGLSEIIETYKESQNKSDKDEIIQSFCEYIWSCSNKRIVNTKYIKFKVLHPVPDEDIGKLFEEWSSIPYKCYAIKKTDLNYTDIIRQKINNLYSYYCDKNVCLDKEYIQLLHTPQNLYYKWINGKQYDCDEITEIINQNMFRAIKIREKNEREKLNITWKEYKQLINGFIQKIFENVKLFCDYTDEQDDEQFALTELWNEDHFYVSYICKSLQGYMQSYQKKYYGLCNINKNCKYKIGRCKACGDMYKQTHHRQQFCEKCRLQESKDVECICERCGITFTSLRYKHYKNICSKCYDTVMKERQKEQSKQRMKKMREKKKTEMNFCDLSIDKRNT